MGVVIEVIFFEECLQVVSRDIKGSFEGTALLACLDGTQVSAVACQQAYGSKQYALSCTGLTGNCAEAFVQINIKVLYQSVVFYV